MADRPEDHTPVCACCERPIMLLEDAVVMLRGQFLWLQEDRYAPMVLDPDTQFEVVEIETDGAQPQKALVLDPHNTAATMVVVMHLDCMSDAMDAAREEQFDPDLNSDDPDADLDALERDFHDALMRDRDPEMYEDDPSAFDRR